MTVSVKKHYERMSAEVESEGQPVDSGYVWTIADNLLHMVDESYKYRLHFVDTGLAVIDHTFFFPTALANNWQYPRYDVRVLVIGFIEVNVRVGITSPYVSYTPALLGGLIGAGTTTLPDTVPGDLLRWADIEIVGGTTQDAPFVPLFVPGTPDNQVPLHHQAWVKLTVLLDPEGAGEGGPFFAGLSVREFPPLDEI